MENPKEFIVPDHIQSQIEEALKSLDSPKVLSGLLDLLNLSIFIENSKMPPYENIRQVFTEVLSELDHLNHEHADLLKGRRWEKLSVDEMIQKRRPQQWSASQFYKIQSQATSDFVTLLWQKELKLRKESENSRTVTNHPEEYSKPDKGFVLKNKSRILVYPLIILVVLLGIVYMNNQPASQGVPTYQIVIMTDTKTASVTPTLTTEPMQTPEQVLFCGESERIPVDFGVDRFVRSQGISRFTSENTPGILSNRVRSVFIDYFGLWIGYFSTTDFPGNGLGQFDKKGKTISNCSQPGITEGQDVNAIVVDQTGQTWVGMEKGGIASYNGNSWRLYTSQDGLPSDWVYSLYVDQKNQIWAGTWEGVALYDGADWHAKYSFENGTIFDNRVHAVAIDSKENIWVGHIDKGISFYSKSTDQWIHFQKGPNALGGNSIRGIAVRKATDTEPESVWVATLDGGISIYEGEKWTVHKTEDGLPSNEVRAVAIDKYNRVWAATAAGTSYYDGKKWIVYDNLDTSSLSFGVSCPDKSCSINDDNIWTGTSFSGITHSRLPLENEGLTVVKICFVSMDHEEICPTLTEDKPGRMVIANYPKTLKPGEQFFISITVAPESPYQLLDTRGDMLVNTDVDAANLFGTYERVAVKGSIDSGQSYTFVDYNSPMTAPELDGNVTEKTFFSNWRVWMYTRYIDPSIRISFTVKK